MMRFLAEGKELTDYSAADLIVGKAAAMLFVKAGIRAVYDASASFGKHSYIIIKRGLPCNPLRSGDPTGNRTRVTAVKGRCLDRLTIGPK